MTADVLKTVTGVAGLAGIAMLVFFFLFREVIRKAIFPQLSKQQAYRLMTLIVCLITGVVLAGIVAWAYAKPGPQAQELIDLPPVELNGNGAIKKVDVPALSRIRPAQLHCRTIVTNLTSRVFEIFEPKTEREIVITGTPGTLVPLEFRTEGKIEEAYPGRGSEWVCHGVFRVRGVPIRS